MRGDFTSTPTTLDTEKHAALLHTLGDPALDNEPNRVAAAYTLANTEAGVYELLKLMYTQDDCVRRSVMYGLGSVRSDVIADELAAMLATGKKLTAIGVSDALAALGMMGRFSVKAIPVVLKVCKSARASV